MSTAADIRALLARRRTPLTASDIKAVVGEGHRTDVALSQMAGRGELLRTGDKPYGYRLNPDYTRPASARRRSTPTDPTELLRRRIGAVLRAEGGPVTARQVAGQLPGTSARDVLSELNSMAANGLVFCDGREFTLQAGTDLLPPPPVDDSPDDDSDAEAEAEPAPPAAARTPAPPLTSTLFNSGNVVAGALRIHKTTAVGKSEALPSAMQHHPDPDPVAHLVALALAKWIVDVIPPQLIEELGAALAQRKAA